MTTLDARDLDAVTGGILDGRPAGEPVPRPELPVIPKLPNPGTYPLGPYYPPLSQSSIA